MKTIKKIIGFFFLAVILQSCNKNELKQDAGAAHQKDIDQLQSFFDQHKSQKTIFTIDPSVGGIFTATSGAKLYIKPNAFKRKDGTIPTSTITLEYTDILDIDNMIFYDKPTTTSNDEQLISYCEIFISAKEGNNLLNPSNLIADPIVATVPTTTPFTISSDTFDFDIPIWLGDTTLYYQLNGLDYEARPVSLIRSKLMNKGIIWDLAWGRGADFITKANSTQKDSVSYVVQNFDVWLNCDQLNFDTRPRTKLFCYFNDHFNNPDTLFYKTQTSYVYYKPKARNILVKVTNPILNAIPTKEGFYTNDNLSPIGLDGKFIAFSIINGKYYAEVKTAIIPAPAAGKTYSALSFDPVEVTETQLLAMIQSLKNY
ncbi:MAG: hypothetical protein U0U67_08865 [Chitinophagales bacterium]